MSFIGSNSIKRLLNLLKSELDKKADKNQGTANAGKYWMVGSDGDLTFGIPATGGGSSIFDGLYTIEYFGGKSGDSSFDNTNAFLNAIAKLKDTGGTLLFSAGYYYFKTPISISDELWGIRIIGISKGINNQGTRLIYTGDGYFMTFTGLWNCSFFENLQIDCTGKFGINFDNHLIKSGMRHCTFWMCNGSLILNGYSYAVFEEITFITQGENVQFCLKLGENKENSKLAEFCYFRRCTFEGGEGLVTSADAITIYHGTDIMFDECDIANWTSGRAFYFHNNFSESVQLSNIIVQNTNIIRCDGGVEFFADKGYIGEVIFDKVKIITSGNSNTEKCFYVNPNSTYTSSPIIKNQTIVSVGVIEPSYVFENANGRTAQCLPIEIIRNSCANAKIDTGMFTRAQIYDCRLLYDRVVDITADGITKKFTINLTNNSPFRCTPIVNVSANVAIAFSISVYNTNGGEMGVDIEFSNAPSGDIKLQVSIGHHDGW